MPGVFKPRAFTPASERRGETAAILLAEAIGAELLLIDERAGRLAAEARGVRVRGTLGVLVRARGEGLVEALRPLLDGLAEPLRAIVPDNRM